MSSGPVYEVIRAGDVRAGDRVNRARARAFYEVRAVVPLRGGRVLIEFVDAGESRPRASSEWWRELAPGR